MFESSREWKLLLVLSNLCTLECLTVPNLLYWHRRCSGSEKEIDTLCFSPLWLKASRAILYMRQNKVASKSRAIFVNPRLWVGSVSMKSKCLRVIGFTLRFKPKYWSFSKTYWASQSIFLPIITSFLILAVCCRISESLGEVAAAAAVAIAFVCQPVALIVISSKLD